jgi:dihydrofolate reductase
MDIVLVAAVAENGVIGRGNTLPWRLKSDMQHFRALTMGKPVVMGRKDIIFRSASRSRAAPQSWSAAITPSLRRNCRRGKPRCCVSGARGDALRRNADAIIVAGGAEIYAQACCRRRRSSHHPCAQKGRWRCPFPD